MDEFSVSFTDPLIVDMALFTEWLHGKTDVESTKKLSCSLGRSGAPFHALLQEVHEQFVLFSFLEQYLHTPQSLNSPTLCSLAPLTKEKLIESYYEFDKRVVREILGKKMSSKLRKDMDEVSEKTDVTLRSCRRQFDNIKNILKCFEDMEGNLTGILSKQFHFSEKLIKKYLPLTFMFVVRFETTKKRLQYLTYDDFVTCSEHIMERWCCGHERSIEVDEIDQSFLEDLRDLRNVTLERDFMEEHKNLILLRLEKKPITLHSIKSFETNFRVIYRNLFSIGADLTHTKDFRDFFNDVVEKIIEPAHHADWSDTQMNVFLSELIDSWSHFSLKHQALATNYDFVFIRYMDVMRKCILQMYR